MSSDGWHDDDEYSADSSSTEWYWNDTAEPTQADDLAEHALPSPVWDEDAYYLQETTAYFSDWEYYSDDYFDQKSPSIENDIGPEPHRSSTGNFPKRRPEERRKYPEILRRYLHDPQQTFLPRGTVYRAQDPPDDSLDRNYKPDNLAYKPGRGQKVALLKDWREVFKQQTPPSYEDKGKADLAQVLRRQKPSRNAEYLSEADPELFNVSPHLFLGSKFDSSSLNPTESHATALPTPALCQLPISLEEHSSARLLAHEEEAPSLSCTSNDPVSPPLPSNSRSISLPPRTRDNLTNDFNDSHILQEPMTLTKMTTTTTTTQTT